MEDAGFILGSYFLTFATVALFAWRTVRWDEAWRAGS